MKFTQAEVDLHNERIARLNRPHAEKEYTPCEHEVGKGALHDKISEECDRRGWLYFHGSTAHRTFRRIGEFDFIIAADNGITLYIEAKARGKKQTTEQLGVFLWAKRLGHRVALVRSLEEFIDWADDQVKSSK